MTLPKFPELVADPTTNEQRICEWRRVVAEKLEEDVDLRIIHAKMVEELGYVPTSPNYIDGFINGYKKAREEVLACLRPQK